jgi:hypothetical protein
MFPLSKTFFLERIANQCRGRPVCLPRWLRVKPNRGRHTGLPLPCTQLQTTLKELPTRICPQKCSALEVLESLPELLLRVHYYRAVPGHRLFERLS